MKIHDAVPDRIVIDITDTGCTREDDCRPRIARIPRGLMILRQAGAKLFALSLVNLLLSGCGTPVGSSSQPPTRNPQYAECVSTTPVDAGNRNQPVITLSGPRVVNQPLGTIYVDQGATAIDPHDGDLTAQVQVTGLSDLNTNAIGDYLIRYNVGNSAKLSATEAVRIVRVTNGTFSSQTARDIGTTSAHMAYYEHLPVQYSNDSNQRFPLILYQHGAGAGRFTDDGAALKTPLSGLELGDMVKLIHDGLWDDSRPFIVLSPQRCVDPIIYFVTAGRTKLFLDYAINTYNVDTSSIYVAGYSAGSSLTWDYVNNYPQQIAAVVPMSGSWGTESGCTLKLTPAWAFQAADDPVGPPQNQIDTVSSINACNPVEHAKITVFPSGGHNVQEEFMTIDLTGLGQGLPQYDIYNESIYDWLLQHSRP